MSRSKKITLGFQVVNVKTGEKLSPVFARRAPAREIAAAVYKDCGTLTGVRTIEEYVAADASPETIAALREGARS